MAIPISKAIGLDSVAKSAGSMVDIPAKDVDGASVAAMEAMEAMSFI